MGLPGVVHKEEDAQSTTHAAVTEGTIIIRNEDAQHQDLNTLSRDTDSANEILEVIFDKDKEQKRLDTVQAISDISTQFRAIVQGEVDIAAMKEAVASRDDPDAVAAFADKLKKANEGNPDFVMPSDSELAQLTYDDTYNSAREEIMKEYGTGSNFVKGVDAVTAGLQGLADDIWLAELYPCGDLSDLIEKIMPVILTDWHGVFKNCILLL